MSSRVILLTRFASSAIQLTESDAQITGGEITDTLGAGIMASNNSTIIVSNMNIQNVESGATPFGYGIVANNNAFITTENVVLKNNKMAGMLMDHAVGSHTDLIVENNTNRGVWMQHCKPISGLNDDLAVTFHGTNTKFIDNLGVSLGAYKSKGIRMNAGEISKSSKIQMIAFGTEVEVEKIGDGIELLDTDDVIVKDVEIIDSERIGVLIDGNPEAGNLQDDIPLLNIVFENVKIDGVGERGFTEQRGRTTQGPDVIPDLLLEADARGGLLNAARPLPMANVPVAVDLNNDIDL